MKSPNAENSAMRNPTIKIVSEGDPGRVVDGWEEGGDGSGPIGDVPFDFGARTAPGV
jgi:hypothetical protein